MQGETLPGRLLFVRNGVIWLWAGNQAKPWIGDGNERQPAWSPDGNMIAYVEQGESYTDVMLADAEGNHVRQLTFYGSDQPLQSLERIYETMWAFYPTWAPDGSHLTIASQYNPPYGSPAIEYNLSLFHLALDGSGKRQQLYANRAAHCGSMAYQPRKGKASSSILAFVQSSIYGEGYPQIYLLDLETETATVFPGVPPHSYDPAFFPDGQWLAFAARSGTETDIWVVPVLADTANRSPTPMRLTRMGRARAPTFSPDGRLLAFLAIPPGGGGFELWVAPVRVNELGTLTIRDPKQITHKMSIDADSGLSWAP